MALRAKQDAFCREYLVDLNATQAAIRAGYSEHTAKQIGQENLTKPDIQTRIRELMDERSKQTGIDAEWVLSRFVQIAERCMQAEPILDREGSPTGEYKFDSSGANKALENIGKHLGMFTDKVKVEGGTDNTLNVIFNIPRPKK